MKNLIYILIPVLMLPLLSFSQVSKERDVIAGGGSNASAGNVNLSWTIGEVATNFSQAGNLIISEGFQQGTADPVGVSQASGFSGTISVYPNPTTDLLNFKVTSSDFLELTGEMFDMAGKRVMTIPKFQVSSEYKGEIDFSPFPSGQWLLIFSDSKGSNAESFTITKVE